MNNYSVTTKGKSTSNPTHAIHRYLTEGIKPDSLPVRSKSKKSKSKRQESSGSTQNKTKNKMTPNKNGTLKDQHHNSKKKLLAKGTPDQNRTLSNDKTNIKKQFVRKNNVNENKRSKSKKTSKKSTDNDNEQTLVQHLKAENQYYRQAYQTSKESLDKLQRALQEEKQRRSSQKNWFQHQITTLKRKLSADKIKLGHIFTYQSFKEEGVSDMILEAQNESSMLTKNNNLIPHEQASQHLSGFSNLSVNSK